MKTYLKGWVLIVLIFLFSFNAFANPFDNTNLSSGDAAYWPQPYRFEKNEWLLVDIKTTPEILRALVPEPLKPNPENIISLYIGRFNIVEPGKVSYLEAGLIIPASIYEEKTKKEKWGGYLPILYLDKMGPIIGGREIYGFPKQDAEIEFARNDNLVHAIVKKYGEIIIDLKFEIKKKAELTNTESSLVSFVFKRIPSANLKNEYEVRQITSVESANYMIDEQFLGNASLKLGSTVSDPLDQIPVLEVVNGRFEINNFTMMEGEVLHDYLQK